MLRHQLELKVTPQKVHIEHPSLLLMVLLLHDDGVIHGGALHSQRVFRAVQRHKDLITHSEHPLRFFSLIVNVGLNDGGGWQLIGTDSSFPCCHDSTTTSHAVRGGVIIRGTATSDLDTWGGDTNEAERARFLSELKLPAKSKRIPAEQCASTRRLATKAQDTEVKTK